MTNLKHWQEKIKEKRMQSSFSDFLRDICSWYPLVLYKQNKFISLYPETDRSPPVISHDDFELSIPALLDHGLDYDFGISFFDNFQSLLRNVPFSALYNYSGAENSNFAFSVLNSKNCYLSFTVISDCENIAYSFAVKEWCTNVFNSIQVSNHSENIYESNSIIKSYQIFYSKFVENSSDIWFSSNMLWCRECIFSDGLENQSYCIENVPYSEEEYFQKKKEILKDVSKHTSWYRQVNGIGKNLWSVDIQNGNFVLRSEDVKDGMYCFNLKHAKNTFVVGSPKLNEYMYDAFEAWAHGNSHFYWALNAWVSSENLYNSEGIVTGYNIFYSRFLENCNYCLWCIWLRNQEYCILNKQYTKEDWFATVDRIFSRMEEDNLLGDFFPWYVNPFYFNDTIGDIVGDFDKHEIEEAGYLWRDEKIRVDIPEWSDIISTEELKDNQWYSADWSWRINPEVLKKVIEDNNGNYYRIVQMEYDFLVKHNLPLPEIHWLDRMKLNFWV